MLSDYATGMHRTHRANFERNAQADFNSTSLNNHSFCLFTCLKTAVLFIVLFFCWLTPKQELLATICKYTICIEAKILYLCASLEKKTLEKSSKKNKRKELLFWDV